MKPNLRYGIHMYYTYVICYIYINDVFTAVNKLFNRVIHPLKYGHIPLKTM